PRRALRGRDDASVVRAVQMVADGAAQAVVSAGNSGALMALAATRLGTIRGVARPAIAINFPTPTGRQVLLDAGANADCKPEYLRDFALMGSLYAEYALGIEKPRVGLMSIGEEKGKGNELTKAAWDLLAATDIEFVGNVEGRDTFADTCDVIVCDGFVGNVILKTAERTAQVLASRIKNEVKGSLLLRMLAAPLRATLRRVINEFDYAETGGALLLGVQGVAIVCHGSSDAHAIDNAVRFAHHVVEQRLIEHLAGVFTDLEAARTKVG
ncbi:MAG: phosphate acyltransferase PlsX, partial [Armatimonadetes bacterium]|nr:phosphate acyltransferase PlsX [Armatimonadota bacterium]